MTFFLLLGIACSLAHFELMLMAEGASGRLWRVLTAPVLILGRIVYIQPYAVLTYIANSLLWGFCIAAIVFWLRSHLARCSSVRFS